MKQKYFTKKQLEILPDMGYYVELPGDETSNYFKTVCINNGIVNWLACVRNGTIKYGCSGPPYIWTKLLWNCGPTKKCVDNYKFFKTYDEFSITYPEIPKAPNDFESEENGKSRIVSEKSYKLPEGFSYGYYFVDMRDQPWGTFEIIYLSEKKIYCSAGNYKTLGQMIYALKNFNNITHFKAYEDLVISQPEVLDMRTFKQKPKFDIG